MRDARSTFDRPEKIISRREPSCSAERITSIIGKSWASAITAWSPRIVVDVDLPAPGDAQGAGRDVLRDRGARRGDGAVTDGHRSHEDIVAPGADACSDHRAVLAAAVV